VIDLRALVERRQGFLFMPLVYRLAGRLEQMAWEELAEDPTSSAYALRAAQKLFGLQAVVTHFRVGVEAEACGADLGRDADGEWEGPLQLAEPGALDARILERSPLAQALEVTRRLSEELRGAAVTVGVLTGPRTLSSLFAAQPAGLGQLYAQLARAYAERGVRLLLVVEDPRSGTTRIPEPFSLTPLFNVARYFRIPTVLLDNLARGPAAGFDLTLGGACDRLFPLAALEEPAEGARRWRLENAPILATEWEVPQHLPAEQLAAWTDALADAAAPLTTFPLTLPSPPEGEEKS
jgi:hypothetical protein